MATRLFSVVVDALDHIAMTRWWAQALRVPVLGERDDEAWVEIPDGPELLFGPVAEPKTTKNRVHLDLSSETAAHQRATVERLLSLGATYTDIGQGDVRWVVLADPEGNEFCVLEPRATYTNTGPVAAIVVDTDDVALQSDFWSAASGRPVDALEPWGSRLRAREGRGPYLEPTRMDGVKTVKNRVHLDVAPIAGDDHAAEVARLESLGARRIDISQGDVSWVVMADPEDNEFCVLTPR